MTTYAGQEIEIVGNWCSQLGSRMEIAQNDRGRLVGTFASSVGGEEGEQPLIGYWQSVPECATAAIGFVVRWRETPSVTVWAGRYDDSTGTIDATWLLTRPPFAGEEWHSTLIGHDVFRRAPQEVDEERREGRRSEDR
ncbi:MAG: avidin/streptavidin family protein [Acidimicrobiales bacterium]